MKVTQEKLPASQIGLEIEITPEMTKKTYEQVIKKLTGSANIPGFRKGKVPRQILLQSYGITRIKATALEEIIQQSIEQALKQEEIPAISQPRLRSSYEELINNYEPGKPLTFSAAVDVEPEPNLTQYTGLQVKAEEVKYDEKLVDQVMETERQKMATLIPIEGRPAQIGDIAVVDFKGVLAAPEGEEEKEPTPIPGGEATDFQVELLEDKFIPGFVTGMVGMNPGETKEISAQFPDPYVNEELAGKPAVFTVTLKELKEKELPELNDDFAQEVSEYATLAELRSSLEERFQFEAEQKTKANRQQALLTELLKHVEVDMPETMVEQEVNQMLIQAADRLSQQGLDYKKFFTQEMIPQLQESYRGEAITRLKLGLALREVSKRETIQTSSEEIEARVTERMRANSELEIERVRSTVENQLLTEKIIDWLLEHSSVELVPEGSLSAETTAAEDESVSSLTELITEATTQTSPVDTELPEVGTFEEAAPTNSPTEEVSTPASTDSTYESPLS